MEEQNISNSLAEAIESYYAKQLTNKQAEELIAWLSENDENRNHFREIGIIRYSSSQLSKKDPDTAKAWATLLDKIEENGKRPMPKPELRIRLSVLLRVAAAVFLVAVFGAGSIFVFRKQKSKSEIAYFEALAPKGSRSMITLSDGSTVWLNSGTKLRYQSNFGKDTRDLYLEGEAYFVVAKNPDIPFRVKTSDICITATGTAFDVKAYNEEGIIETTLENGEVRIDELDDSKLKVGSALLILKPNQKAVFIKSNKNLVVNSTLQKPQVSTNALAVKIKTPQIKIYNTIDTKLTTSWKDSRWIFKSEKLHDLAPIIERRYDIKIIFRDSILNEYKFTGILKEESLEQVLMALTLAAPIKFDIKHNEVSLYENKSQRHRYIRQVNQQIK
jgi:transmembrane sensor